MLLRSRTLVTALLTAAVLVAVEVALFTGGGGEHAARAAATPLPPLSPVAPNAPRPKGPEGVALVRTQPLGPADSPEPGKSRGGIPCGSNEQLSYHVHVRLTIYVHGKPRAVPLGIGIAPPRRVSRGGGGSFVSGGACYSWLHTHASDGVIHIEAPADATFRLGQFFAVWNQALDKRHLGGVRGHVVAYVNGKRFAGDPRAISLRKHAQIQLEVGRPYVKPRLINFPPGL